MFEKCQHAQTAGLFPPYCVDFPCNTQSIAASNRLVWQKNPSPLSTFPIFKQGLVGLKCGSGDRHILGRFLFSQGRRAEVVAPYRGDRIPGGGGGKPLPYESQESPPCLGRGAPWGSRQSTHRERWLSTVRRGSGSAPAVILGKPGPSGPD